jgi:hypothetical protein
MSTTTNTEFIFSTEMNQSFLQAMYEGDLLYASEVFESFLVDVKKEMEEIKKWQSENDVKKIRHTLHKIKPTFGFVGLTALTEKIEVIISIFDKSSDISETEPAFSKTLTEIQNAFLLVEDELKRMKAYLA